MSKVFTITEGLENLGAVKTGGQGSVYKGKRIGEMITAVKLLPTPVFTQDASDKHYQDFINEVKKLQKVNEEPNPNIVKILSYGISETGGLPYIEMEYIDGPDLAELLKPPHAPVFSIHETFKVAEQLSNALAHCHKFNVKHGDIKSNNVKFNQHTGNYVLLDFGLSILSDEERRTSLRHAGAIEFMAPEQNEGQMFFETDVYSFGIILFELLAGRVPFPLDGNSETARNRVMVAHMETQPPDLMALRASMLPTNWTEDKKAREMQVPEWLLALIYKCLQKKPEDRFMNGAALQEYISHHRTNFIESKIAEKEEKWQSLLAEREEALNSKEVELQQLKTTVQKLQTEVHQERKKNPVATNINNDDKTVSRKKFNVVLAAAILLACVAILAFIFGRTIVGDMQATNANHSMDSIANNKPNLQTSVNNSNAKDGSNQLDNVKPNTEHKNQLPDSIAASGISKKITEKTTNATPQEVAVRRDDADKKDVAKTSHDEAKNNNKVHGGVSYKVRNKAYFHNQPDEATRRDAFITHWNNAILKALDEKNGFIYVVFTNTEGQTSKGWISKKDLIPVE